MKTRTRIAMLAAMPTTIATIISPRWRRKWPARVNPEVGLWWVCSPVLIPLPDSSIDSPLARRS